MDQQSLEELAVQLFDADVVQLGEIEARAGIWTPIYFDLRLVVSYPKLMMAITRQFQRLASDIPYDVLCGVPYAALPFAAVMSVNTNTPMIMKRMEPKAYAKRKILEGVYQMNQNCLVLEDVVTSGRNLMETITALRDEGLKVTHALVFLDREQGGAGVLEANGVQVRSIYKMTGIVGTLRDAGKISEAEVQTVFGLIEALQYSVARKHNE